MLLANLVIIFLVSIPPLKTTRPKKYYLWDMSEGRMNKNRAVVVAMALCYHFKLRTVGGQHKKPDNMKKILAYFIFFFSCIYSLNAQQGGFSSAIWDNYVDLEQAITVVIDNDSNYVMGGYSFVIKLDSNGTVLWKKIYQQNNQFIYISKILGIDTGYMLLYNSGLIKTNKNGNVNWANTVNNVYFTDMVKTLDNGIVAVGSKDGFSKSYVFKFDSLGNTLWSKQIFCNGETNNTFFIKQLPDSSFMLATDKNNQLFFVRLNSIGQVFQSKKANYNFSYIAGSNMIFDGNNFYFTLAAHNGSWDFIYYLNTDTLFNSKHCVRYYSDGNGIAYFPIPFQKHPDGNLIMLSTPQIALQNSQLVKIDSLGTYKSSYQPWFISRDFKILNDGRLLVAGDAWGFGEGSQVGLYRTDFNGENPCIQQDQMLVYTDSLKFVSTTCTTDTFISTVFTTITVSSPSFNFAASCLHVSLDEKADVQTRPLVFPNPGKGFFEITGLPAFFRQKDYTLTLYSSLGQEIPCKIWNANNRLYLETHNQPPGLYMLLLTNSRDTGKPQSLKIIINE